MKNTNKLQRLDGWYDQVVKQTSHFSVHLQKESDYLVVSPKFMIIPPKNLKLFNTDSNIRLEELKEIQHFFGGVGEIIPSLYQGESCDIFQVYEHYSLRYDVAWFLRELCYTRRGSSSKYAQSRKGHLAFSFLLILDQIYPHLPKRVNNDEFDLPVKSANTFPDRRCRIPLGHRDENWIYEFTEAMCSSKNISLNHDIDYIVESNSNGFEF